MIVLRRLAAGIGAATVLLTANITLADVPLQSKWRYAEPYSQSGPRTTEYLLGLGALQKIRSRWRFKDSEIVAAELEQITWQVQEGFTAEEGIAWLRARLPENASLLFECEGRACGSSAQWASRVFEERVLYGHDDRQQYSAWRLSNADETWTLVLYGIDRANRRHFIRLDRLLHLDTEDAPAS
ncbi:MAG: DUF4892 domain-containing protein [Pseudomonadota bacterium]